MAQDLGVSLENVLHSYKETITTFDWHNTSWTSTLQVRSTNFRLKKATSKSRNHGYEFDRNVIAELAALFYQVQRLSQEVSDKQKLDPSYVWACGGLFDQAIQKKYAHQAMVDRDGTKSYYITRPMVQEVRKLPSCDGGKRDKHTSFPTRPRMPGSSFLGSTNQDSDTRSKANHNVDQYNCGDTIGMDEDHSDTLSQFSDEPNDLAAITLPMAAELFGWSTSSAACETAMEVGPKANPTDTCPQRPFPVPTTAGSAKTRPGARGARQSKRLQAASVVKSKAARHAAATQAAMRQKATRFKKREHMRLIRTLVRSIDQVRRQPELGGLIPKGRIDACKKKCDIGLEA
ncbi:hypothetical protein P8C59_006395 [Phyllachora maydis]|uniref:Uncharacterized protein n=1 Tax=Phyllachora maydis TaxID=1825666 RepID=A0AAD9MD71_9PEZI|nr:hypothetical protein P8C59_006395 [Phyllachora maydis]